MIGILFNAIYVKQTEASHLYLVNQLSISWGINGINITSPSGGASNLTITKDDVKEVDADSNSSDEFARKANQSVTERSRLSWFPGGLHELNNQIMSEITDDDNDDESEATDLSLLEKNTSEHDEAVEVEDEDEEAGIDAVAGDEESQKGIDDDSVDEDDNSTEANDESPPNGQRGGAMVKEAKRRFPFLEPLETGKVASAASRLINDNAGEGNIDPVSVVRESPIEVDQHVQVVYKRESADIMAESVNVDTFFDVELDVGNDGLDASDSQIEDIANMNLTSNLTSSASEDHRKSYSIFRGIRKSTAKLTHLHGFFSRKYSNQSLSDTPITNSSIQQEMVETEDENHSEEVSGVRDFAPTQRLASVESETDEMIIVGEPTDGNGKEQLDEATHQAEENQLDATVADSDRTELTESSFEEKSVIHDDVTREPGRIAPADNMNDQLEKESARQLSPYESSGMWSTIDAVLTLGLANNHPSLRTSHYLRGVRKVAAKYTGLHGFLSGKNHSVDEIALEPENEQLGMVRRRLAAIERARKRIPDGSFGIFGRRNSNVFDSQRKKSAKEALLQRKKMERVKEIDKLFAEYQQRILDLVCEKDMLQRRPNPLWNYTSEEENLTIDENVTDSSPISLIASRRFNFPPQDLVDNYLEVLFLSERLVKLNHTDLWRDSDDDDDDEDLSEDFASIKRQRKNNAGGRNSGNWLLRNGLGQKIGEAAEMAAYKSVCKALMSVLARSISSIHGLNVMKYSDIRLSMEHTPGLPPLLAGMIPGSDSSADYATRALEGVMFRGAKKNKHKRRFHRRKPDLDFLQRGAIVETLLSHAQISAPLLQLFPLAWQRELLSNIITMATTIISDFCEGLEFHILGHRLSFSFTPITEDDMLRGITSDGFNRKRPDPEQYEAAIRATADDLSNELKFLDRWHERALGSDMLRSQIANLIARLVIHLVDDLLRGARLDLWASHGGPRLVAGLEFRNGDVKEPAR